MERGRIKLYLMKLVNPNLYDIICDKIGQLQKENSEPIPYEKNNAIKR